MKRVLLASLLCVSIVGCATPEMRAGWKQEAEDRCELSGIGAADPRRGACERVLEGEMDAEYTQSVRQGVALGLLNVQQQMQQRQMVNALRAPRTIYVRRF